MKILKILLIIIVALIGVGTLGLFISTLINKSKIQKTRDSIKPYGDLIDVDGGKMHVYSEGNGKETIVLLPGYGTCLPSADFGPLVRELKNDYTVVVVEYFGIGLSSETDKPRTNENVINETRECLSKAGFKAPYILMPHSLSGIYSQYYANKHPEEVKGIIMLDTTPSIVEEKMISAPTWILKLSKLLQNTGLSKALNKNIEFPQKLENGYTDKELSGYKAMEFCKWNDTLINQGEMMVNDITEVSKLEFPSNIPVLKLMSSETLKAFEQQLGVNGLEYQQKHLDMLGNKVESKVLDGSHALYQTLSKEISELATDFINKNCK